MTPTHDLTPGKYWVVLRDLLVTKKTYFLHVYAPWKTCLKLPKNGQLILSRVIKIQQICILIISTLLFSYGFQIPEFPGCQSGGKPA